MRRRSRLPKALLKCFEHRSESSVQSRVTQIGFGRFLVYPTMFIPARHYLKVPGNEL